MFIPLSPIYIVVAQSSEEQQDKRSKIGIDRADPNSFTTGEMICLFDHGKPKKLNR
jgi:hypothetical protein